MTDMDLKEEAARPRINVSRWQPCRWDECIGNSTLKSFFQTEVREIRGLIDRTQSLAGYRRPNVLASGPTRTGKTSLCKLFCESLTCEMPDEHLNPCDDTCGPCRDRVATCGETGLETVLRRCDGRPCIDVRQVDCGLVTPGDMKEIIDSIRYASNDLLIVLFDEAHRLAARQADEMLLKVTEEREAMFILATVAPEKLDPMVRARFTHIRTQLPTQQELARFLLARCRDWDIGVDADALIRLIERSRVTPGIALNALALAVDTNQDLTLEFVNDVWIPPVD